MMFKSYSAAENAEKPIRHFFEHFANKCAKKDEDCAFGFQLNILQFFEMWHSYRIFVEL